MKLRKLWVSILAVMMLMTSLQVSAFAEDDHYDNLSGCFYPENDACLQTNILKEAQEAKMVLTKNDDPSITVSLPLTFEGNKYYQQIVGNAYLDMPEMRAILSDLTEKNKENSSKMRTKKSIKASFKDEFVQQNGKPRTKKASFLFGEDVLEGYTVTVENLDGHFALDGYYAILTTEATIQEEIDMYVTLIKDYGGKDYKNYVQPETYAQLMDDFGKARGYADYRTFLLAEEYTEEEIQEEMDIIKDYDAILTDIEQGEFYGILDIDGGLKCDCPVKTECYIVHNYYKMVEGKRTLIYSNEEEITVTVGDTLYAKDYLKPEHAGESYVFTESLEYFDQKPMDEFVITEFWDNGGGFILCYDLEEEAVVVPEDGAGDGASDEDKPEQPKRKPEVVTGEAGPNTGDYTPMGVYLFVIAMTAGALVFMNERRKKQK